ncbi:hypothetical protein EVAR_63996_1 [Eumeta japonica]|uniref:Uncharacterized protein n=1 Tax=Eumeta variegata TaxID=151549 RepID=A0A4C1Z3J6_EUMVA|nr:hypothetical protein EVAR_63996_1 [Eumeta japonica]
MRDTVKVGTAIGRQRELRLLIHGTPIDQSIKKRVIQQRSLRAIPIYDDIIHYIRRPSYLGCLHALVCVCAAVLRRHDELDTKAIVKYDTTKRYGNLIAANFVPVSVRNLIIVPYQDSMDRVLATIATKSTTPSKIDS